MGTTGNSIIKGVGVDSIISILNKAYADEWLAYYQYFVQSKVVKGIMKDSVVAELVQHAADELRHANLVADRVIQLGGTPILNPQNWFDHSSCGYVPPTDFDVRKVLDDSIKGEQCAINIYSQIAELTRNKDIVTYDLVSQILADEVEHEEDLQGLYEDISGFVEEIRKSAF